MSTFFLTDLDPRAATKGSRDPLGFQPVWTYFGRQVVTNLTTVTRSVRNFTTLLLGFYFADKTLASGSTDDERQRLNAFLRFEQMAAYTRVAYGDKGTVSEVPLGVQRVRNRIRENNGRLTISEKSEHQILSSQTLYGLWGLYRVAAAQSGLILVGEERLSPLALEFVEMEYLPRMNEALGKDGREILKFLQANEPIAFEPKGRDKRLGEALASILSVQLTAPEREFYKKTLVHGNRESLEEENAMQPQLWRTIDEVNTVASKWQDEFDARELALVIERARSQQREALAEQLSEIQILEPVLSASNRCFSFLLQRGDASLDQVISDIRKTWGTKLTHIAPEGVRRLESKINGAVRNGSGERIVKLAASLGEGDYESVVKVALKQNEVVMKERNGAPWIAIEDENIKVKQLEGGSSLPSREELPYLWANPYFINSLKSVGRTVVGKS